MVQMTLFDRLGGARAVSRIILAFYERVLESDRLQPFFAGADMRRIVDHQAKFIAFLMGGPASYTDEELEEIHSGLAVDPVSFHEMLTLLRETLERHGLEPSDIDALMAELERREANIVMGGGRPDSRVA
jgi:hemoglobin